MLLLYSCRYVLRSLSYRQLNRQFNCRKDRHTKTNKVKDRQAVLVYMDRELLLNMFMDYRVKYTISNTKSMSERRRVGRKDGRGNGSITE